MNSMRVLVLGAEGFIGSFIATALRSAGHKVVVGGRRHRTESSADDFVICDFDRDLDAPPWAARLRGIDAVVNCIGILRENCAGSFERIHVQGPVAMFRACERDGVRRVIQISALGAPEIGEYLASKHRCDDVLIRLDLDWTILRPSLVYSPCGSYGGTSLLRALAALPNVMVLPGDGMQRIQPILADDLAQLVVRLLEDGSGVHQIVEAVGPEPMTFCEFLVLQRRWLELPTAQPLRTPAAIAQMIAWLGERFGNGPLGLTMWRMLQRGNIGAPDAADKMTSLIGRAPTSVQNAFRAAASFVQDRWHARLYFMAPVLRITIALLWILSGCVGFLMPLAESRAMLTAAGIAETMTTPLVWIASTMDIVLGVLALFAWRVELVAALMLVSLIIYTLFVGILIPTAWMEPLGGLLKNIVLMPAVIVMATLSSRR